MKFSSGLGLIIFVLLPAPALPAEGPPREAVLALIERQKESWETGNEAEFLSTLNENVVFAYPGKRLDRAGALQTFREWKRDFHDTHFYVSRCVIEGSRFSLEYTFATTKTATGKRTAAGTAVVGEIKDGLIVVWKEYLDGRVSRLQATGELPVDEKAEPFPWPDTPQSRKPE